MGWGSDKMENGFLRLEADDRPIQGDMRQLVGTATTNVVSPSVALSSVHKPCRTEN